MDEVTAREAIERAEMLASATGATGEWLVRYYVVFGVSSWVFATAFGFVRDWRLWPVILCGAWLLVVAALSLYANTRRSQLRGAARLHGAVMATWAVVWAVTVTVGSGERLAWPWWCLGGFAMALVALVGAWFARARAREGLR